MVADVAESLAKPPFSLNGEALDWARKTFASLTPEERLHQLFVLRSGVDDATFERIRAFRPGGITAVFSGDPAAEVRRIASLWDGAKVPPFISADLEGSGHSFPFGTEVPNPIALGAINDVAASRTIKEITAKEARSV